MGITLFEALFDGGCKQSGVFPDGFVSCVNMSDRGGCECVWSFILVRLFGLIIVHALYKFCFEFVAFRVP